MPTPRKHEGSAQRQQAYRERQKVARLEELRAKNMPPVVAVSTMPSVARWSALIEQAKQCLWTVHSEMETYRDDRSDAWQQSENADVFQDRIDRVQEAISSIEDIG